MKEFIFFVKLEIKESIKSKSFVFYLFFIALLITSLFYFGLAESSIMGFTGLTRLLLILIQISIIVLPLFALITTVRQYISDKETGVLEFNLSMPIKLLPFYLGKGVGKFLTLSLPLILSFYAVGIIASFSNFAVPWEIIHYYSLFLGANLISFIGISFFISIISKNQEMALGLSFILWIFLELLIDAALLGLLVQNQVNSNFVLIISSLNPIELLRIGSIALFDPDLTVLGPVSYTILEKMGLTPLLLLTILWPSLLGIILFALSFFIFKRKDFV